MQRTIYALLSVLLGISILGVICTLSLYATAHVIQPRVIMMPAIFGGILGFFLFIGHERYRLNKEKLIHLNGVLRAIRDINRILARERDSIVFIQKICDTLVENRSYHSVWIALTDQDGQWGTFAQAALGEDFKSITDIFKNGDPVACCQKVMTQPGVVITDVPLTLCGSCPLVSVYQNRGAISAKLAYNGEIYGMITLSVPEAMLFDPEENRLANELSEDIAFGLHAIKLDEKRQNSEQALNQSLLNLKERMKELNCLYSLSEVIAQHDHTLGNILTRAVDLIPPAFQHPEAACACIQIDSDTYRTDNFEKTDWLIENEIAANGKPIGTIVVGYNKRKHKLDTDPFLLEEKVLVNAIAERLGKTVERSQAQIDLQESEKRFRTLVENSLTGISIVTGHEVVYQNKEQERLLGPLPRSNIMGKHENVHPDDLSRVKQFSKEIINGNTSSVDIDFRYLPERDVGEPVWIHCRAANVVYRKQPSILFNMIDMTRPKELEKLLIAQDKMASLGRVAAGIAHEIRNPLSGINIYLNTLEKFFDRGESREKVKQVFLHLQSASRKIESVIRRVMDFSKPSQPNFILTDVNGPIEEALRLMATTLRKSGILLEIKLTRDLPTCRIDPQQFEEVILNMINNAADSLRGVVGKKRIKVTSGVHKHQVVVQILDSGPGIVVENREKVFDPFFTTKTDSTGIGLSICQRIISDHSGKIDVQTNEWGGTEFRILIPVSIQTGQART
jgi:PAS domain S-box-containing protein